MRPAQLELMKILQDGKRHTREELHSVLPDEHATNTARYVSYHVSILRKTLNPKGLDVVCEYYRRKIRYRLVRMISMD